MASPTKFKLEILEYCDPTVEIQIEQQFINFLKPEYNIIKIAGSPLGFRHSEEALWKISAVHKGIRTQNRCFA